MKKGSRTPASLEREIAEELDTAIVVGREVFSVVHTYADRVVELHFFACRLTGEPRAVLGQEMRWVTREELRRLPFPPADEELIRMLTTVAFLSVSIPVDLTEAGVALVRHDDRVGADRRGAGQLDRARRQAGTGRVCLCLPLDVGRVVSAPWATPVNFKSPGQLALKDPFIDVAGLFGDVPLEIGAGARRRDQRRRRPVAEQRVVAGD